MLRLKQVSLVCVMLALSTLGESSMPQPISAAAERQEFKDASPEIQAFVRDVIQKRLSAGDIPDIGVAGGRNNKRFTIRADMPEAGLKLTIAALPDLPGIEFELISLADATARAAKTGMRVAFITVDKPNVGTNGATIWLGADYVMQLEPGVIKLCCCESEAHFAKRDGRWVFLKWDQFRCV